MTQAATAVRIHDYGGPEAVRVEPAPIPTPGPGQVLIRVAAAGVNPIDWKIREGTRRDRIVLEMPATLGCDVAGVIERGADGFAPGDAVFAMTGLWGGFSSHVAIDAAKVARKPATLDMIHAAAVPLAALTALQALELAGLEAGQRVLVLGGGGGVGGFAVQIAKALGAEVVATASAGKLDYVRWLGADRVIDYAAVAFEEAVAGVDVVFDLQGGETMARAWKTMKPGGFLVTAVIAPPPEEVAARGMRAARVGVTANGAQLARIASWIDEGRISVHVEATYPLAEASVAIERVKGGRTKGKIVLAMPAA